MLHEVGGTVLLRSLALVQDDFDLHAPLMGIDQGFGDGSTGKAICLDEDRRLGVADLLDHRIRAATVRAEIDLDGRRGLGLLKDFGRFLGAAGRGEEKDN